MTKLTALFLICLTITPAFKSEPVPFSINTKKWSHVLDDHFISITVNPTDLLQGKVYGLAMNSTMSILKGLAPAYVRIGSADTAKYTFKKNRYPSDMIKPEDEYTVTEAHWMGFNEVVRAAGLDVIVCLNAAHRVEGTKKWDTRNSLELISFSDSQGYNLTWQLGYEVQSGEDISGLQFGKDLNRLRTILNAFPRYQNSKLIGPDIRVVHKKEDIDFWNDVLVEAGPTLDAVTWHPRWPQPSKMKVSDNSDLGYEFPADYLEWDKAQLNKILQKSIFKNPVWIGETKRESTGTFAEGLIWARRLVLAAKSGIEVVMKQPNLMDVSHPKPEYWIALLHKRLLGKSVLETRSVSNNTDLAVISHCTNPYYWSDKPEKLQDGAIAVYGVNMGGFEQKIQIKGTWTGKSQLIFQYVLTSGSDPDSVFSQMTYLNGEPLMMTDDGSLPDIIPKIKKLEKGLTMKLPPYSVGFWVVPEARVKICQIQPHSFARINIETLTPSSIKSSPNLENIQDINQFLVEKLTNPESESDEVSLPKIEPASSESTEKEIPLTTKENALPRVARRIRQVKPINELNQELKSIMKETEEFLTKPELMKNLNSKMKQHKASPNVERKIQTIAEGISDAIKTTNQEHEFNKFLEESGLKKNFGSLLINDRRFNAPGMNAYQPYYNGPTFDDTIKQRLRRSISKSEEVSQEEESMETDDPLELKFRKKISLVHDESEDLKKRKQDLVIPHQPDIKGLEERYKQIVHSKIKDGKRKIDDMKRKIKLEEANTAHKIKQPESVNDIQEEIIKREIELLEKTEETVADILKSQKKRQETFEDIIFEELNDVKGERIMALKDLHKNQKKKENTIVKRQIQTPLSRPLLKTVEYIEKNFNLEPQSVRKIKRSLEEKMGEILKTYDTKKSLETKKRSAPTEERREKKISLKKTSKDDDRDDEHYGSRRGEEDSKDRLKEKNVRKVSTAKSHHTTKTLRKPETVTKESTHKSRKSEENKRKQQEDENDSFELFNEQKPLETSKRSDRRRSIDQSEQKTKFIMRESKGTRKEESTKPVKVEPKIEKELEKEQEKEKIESIEVEKTEEVKKEKFSEHVPLKHDKERRENMLKQITSMVDHMHSMELNGERLKRMDEDEDISEEFESDRKKRKIRRWPRRAEVSEIKPEAMNVQPEVMNVQTESMNVKTEVVNSQSKDMHVQAESMNVQSDATNTQPKAVNVQTESMNVQSEVANSQPKVINTQSNIMSIQPEISEQPQDEPKPEVIITTQPPVTPTTPTSKLSKLKRLRPRLRKQKEKKTAIEDVEESKTKRHLVEIGRPLIELDKKKLPKVKPKKHHPKLFKYGNELLTDDKEKIPEMSESVTVENTVLLPPDSEIKATDPKEELLKDLEEIVEEKLFLGQGTKTSNEESGRNGEEFSEKKKEIDFSGETPTPTEGYIIVEPTVVELKENPTKKVNGKEAVTEKIKSEVKDCPDDIKDNEMKKAKTFEFKFNEKKEAEDEITESAKVKKKDEKLTIHAENEKESSKDFELSIKDENLPKIRENSEEKKDIFLSNDFIKSKNEKAVAPASSVKEEGNESEMTETDNSHRKRRATFVPNHGEDDDEEEDDYSSEERIQKFKQMVYKTSPARKNTKNEVRPSGGMGLGADEFLKMAGSTVRVMFDDVIPEAYGQTKTKIQSIGISDYIKEFGKIVQQMKNLDQIFLNIGEAAVKGYIRGNKAEKGPYIQVISRKKRSTDEVTENPPLDSIEITTKNEFDEKSTTLPETTTELVTTPESNLNEKIQKGRPDETEYATTTSSQTISDQRKLPCSDNQHGYERREDVLEVSDREIVSEIDTSYTAEVQTTEKTEASQVTEVKAMESSSTEESLDSFKTIVNPKIVQNLIPQTFKQIQPRLDEIEQPDLTIITKDIKPKTHPLAEDLKERISPWIKTTKDFIRQAITTLQRQRELSEMLARESLNGLMNNEMRKKVIGKRDVSREELRLPVYYTKNSVQRKRETQQKFSDESLIRHLRGLQPGVYVVPTEEMTNIRSEQITNEAKQKSGLPNVVTLNIYYDKKIPEAKSDASTQTGESVTTQDAVTYYQNTAWNPATGQYEQSNQYLSPVGVPDISNSLVAPVPANPVLQANPVYAAEPRIAELPNSRLIQYPASTYHYPPVAKMYPPVVTNPQSMYSPLYYVPQENRVVSHSPGTKRQWREFKARSGGVPIGSNSGWNIQFEPVPGTIRSSIKPLTASSYNKNFKLFSDKKRSVGDFKPNPTWSESALPFWKFFSTSSSEKKNEKTDVEDIEEKQTVVESESLEDVFEENRKRAKGAADKKSKMNSLDSVTEDPKEVEEEVETEAETEAEPKEVEEKSRKRRSINKNNIPGTAKSKKLSKRSYPYEVEFKDHDILPEWFGTYHEIDNSLDHLPPHVRRSHIISSPWSEEDEEIINILDADDELSLVDMDNDYYYSNDNSIAHLRRYPRSTDQFDSHSIKSNMIYKMPMDVDHVKSKMLGMTGIKKLTDEDSSLELVTKAKPAESKTPSPQPPTPQPPIPQQNQQLKQQPTPSQIPQMTTQQFLEMASNSMQNPQNGTNMPPRNPHDDTFYYFFKYAYDSFVKVMKSMTQLL